MQTDDESLPAPPVPTIGRRELIRRSGAFATAAILLPHTVPASAAPPCHPNAGDTLVTGTGIATVATAYGEVAGYRHGSVFAFKGIPYADSTAGEHRFRAPRPPSAWTGIRSCRHFGPVCPQDKGMGRFHDEEAFIFQWNDSVEHEDCLRVNVWTPGLGDGGKRPVMVWLHGGGFVAGSGHDIPAFDGENLAQRGDVVVVTLNHRLNLLGFLDLSAHGETFADSANVGMLDIVAALEWVRDNIARFGGDPARVTVFGQSGGGGKVGALMAMPAARGLFHRAGIMSGSFRSSLPQERARRLAELVIAELGLDPRTAGRLRELPYAELRRASDAVLARENPPAGAVPDVRRIGSSFGYAPVVDGRTLPIAPFADGAPAASAGVPMMIGTTLNEFANGISHPDFEQMGEDELAARVEAEYPGRSAHIVAAFRARTPAARPCDLWSRIATAPIRHSAIAQASAKHAQQVAPAWLYVFARTAPVLDGRARAFHCADIPYAFNNTDRCASMTGGGSEARRVGEEFCDRWVAFARSGNPDLPGLPHWAPYDPVAGTTMVFEHQGRAASHPDRGELGALLDPAAG